VLVVSAARGIPLYGPSGASAHLRGVVGALRRAGHRVTVAVPTTRDDRGAVDDPVDAEAILTAPPPPRHRPRWVREIAEVRHSRRLLRDAPDDIDLVWERHSLHADGGWRLAQRRGIPRLLQLDAPLSLERALRDPVALPWLARRLERASLRHADKVLAVSRWLVPWARGQGARDVRHVPNATLPDPPPPLHGRGEGLVIGYIGSCQRWHELDRLPALLGHLPEARALVIGDGPCPPPHHPRIDHVPACADPRPALRHVHVGIAPGRPPPWVCPLKLLDYRAMGLRIVSTDVGDSRELVGDAGEVLPVGAGPATWARAIRRQAAAAPPAPWVRTWDHVVAETLSG